jgi:hypothetical protein
MREEGVTSKVATDKCTGSYLTRPYGVYVYTYMPPDKFFVPQSLDMREEGVKSKVVNGTLWRQLLDWCLPPHSRPHHAATVWHIPYVASGSKWTPDRS